MEVTKYSCTDLAYSESVLRLTALDAKSSLYRASLKDLITDWPPRTAHSSNWLPNVQMSLALDLRHCSHWHITSGSYPTPQIISRHIYQWSSNRGLLCRMHNNMWGLHHKKLTTFRLICTYDPPASCRSTKI